MAGVEDNLAPVADELSIEAVLPVDGAIPPVLEGLFVRNGPNASTEGLPYGAGDGMVHAVALRDGQAVSYRNRWVRTRALAARTGGAVPGGPSAPADDPANTNVVWHSGRLLAVGTAGLPHALTTDLETIAVDDFGGALSAPVAGHPRFDPDTGSVVWIRSATGEPPFLHAMEIDRGGTLVSSADVALARAARQRDVGLTATQLVVFDLPERAQPTHTEVARIGVLERGRPGETVRWLDLDPCVVSHVANAYDDGDGVVLDLCRGTPSADRTPAGSSNEPAPSDPLAVGPAAGGALDDSPFATGPVVLERWHVGNAGVTISQLDDRWVELPRVDGALAGRPHRYIYCVQVVGRAYGGLVRYDVRRDEARLWDPGPARAAGEAVFVRDPDGHADDEGWILTFVYDAERGASDLVIIDGTSWGGRPDAVVHLPARVPFGLHGSWVPASAFR